MHSKGGIGLADVYIVPSRAQNLRMPHQKKTYTLQLKCI